MIEALKITPLKLKRFLGKTWDDKRRKDDAQRFQKKLAGPEPFDKPRHFPDDRVVKVITQLIRISRHFV